MYIGEKEKKAFLLGDLKVLQYESNKSLWKYASKY